MLIGCPVRTLALVSLLAVMADVKGAESSVVYPLQRIPPGTRVGDSQAKHWNRLIVIAKPMVTSGEIDRLPSGVQQAVSRFSFTVLATVSKTTGAPAADSPANEATRAAGSGTSGYRLIEVGVGYSAPVQGRPVIVTAAADDRVKADLGFVDRQILSGNEMQLFDTARVVVRSSTLMMFDLAGVLSRKSGHQDVTIRHLVWVDPKTGKSAIAMWALDPQRRGARGADAPRKVQDDPIRVLAGGTRVTNRIHIDGSTFFLGIPTVRTFGLERLPPGKPIEWTDSLRQLAGQSSYTGGTLARLTIALNQAVGATD